ncbi:hypothetical protein [Halostella salina]|uniref:hypothetical protein n=1 Tax=Halostella salina TaxID=1547897 RepID=UPI000EF8106A|nr:hypothetical protein [Halostella salina]
MNRRTVLASCGLTASALSGCLSTLPLGNESPEKRTVSMESVEQNLPGGLRVFVTLTEQRITPDGTAAVEIALKNTGSQSVTLDTGFYFPYTGSHSESGDWLLLAAPPAVNKSSSDCWEPASDNGLGWPDTAERKTVSPGDEHAMEYQLWGNHEDDVCMPPGEFTFEHSYGVPEREATAEWEFSVSITSADAN